MEADGLSSGPVGPFTGLWLSELYDCSVTLIDKEEEVALQTTLGNTGIAHRPFYLNPSKKKVFALSAERSHNLWKGRAGRHGIPWKEIGTLMVATEARRCRSWRSTRNGACSTAWTRRSTPSSTDGRWLKLSRR